MVHLLLSFYNVYNSCQSLSACETGRLLVFTLGFYLSRINGTCTSRSQLKRPYVTSPLTYEFHFFPHNNLNLNNLNLLPLLFGRDMGGSSGKSFAHHREVCDTKLNSLGMEHANYWFVHSGGGGVGNLQYMLSEVYCHCNLLNRDLLILLWV